MDTNQLQFKTNINCSGCVATVKPFLDQAAGLGQWTVDTMNKDKVLTVESAGISASQVVTLVQKAGFVIEALH